MHITDYWGSFTDILCMKICLLIYNILVFINFHDGTTFTIPITKRKDTLRSKFILAHSIINRILCTAILKIDKNLI